MNLTLALSAETLPAPAGSGAPSRSPTLAQSLLLAALLHALLVVVVGTAPGVGPMAGETLWGPVQIRLGGPGPADSPGRA